MTFIDIRLPGHRAALTYGDTRDRQLYNCADSGSAEYLRSDRSHDFQDLQ